MELVIGNKNWSSWSLRPWLGMKVAGVPFRETVIPLRTPDTRARLEALSPTGKVPVLIDGPSVIWESLAIAEYLAEDYPALWPADRAARAHARAVCAEMHAGFVTLRTLCAQDIVGRHTVDMTPALQADVDRIQVLWQDCRTRYGAIGPWLFGHFSWADAFFAPVVLRFVSYAVPVQPAARAYMDTVLALPALQEWIAAAQAEMG